MTPENHPPVKLPRIGVLLINLGTPDKADFWSLRRYLKQFLSDRRVIEVPAWIWQIILNGIILNTRPQKSAEAYRKIWRKDTNESPLRYFTRQQAEKLQERYQDRVLVDWAMRYGQPSISEKILSLKEKGCHKILLFALYPQYSATTSATVYDEAFRALMKMRWQPAIRTVPTYHDEDIYISAIAESIQNRMNQLNWKPEKIVLSFHGLPKKYLLRGDPYHCFCQKSARLIRDKLGWSAEDCLISFQSRFGPDEWLKPYTDETLQSLASQGVKRLLIATPGFVSDCVETLEEIAILNKEVFVEAGGENYEFVDCLNASESGIQVLESVCSRELQGWL